MNATFNFAHNLIATLDVRIANTAKTIADLERQLQEVRENQKALENERQGLLTLAKAGESAIEQAANFLNMAKAAGRADMVEAFWDGIDGLRDNKGELPAAEVEPEPQPEPPAPTEPTIEVEATQVYDSWEAADAAIQAMEPNVPIDPSEGVIPDVEGDEATKPEWKDLNWNEFKKYAKEQGISTRGKTRTEIEAELMPLGGKRVNLGEIL